MRNDSKQSTNPSITIDYETIRDLSFFQEQYDRLTEEIQQVRVQLESSPSLAADEPRAQQREEWRTWLQLQIKSKQQARDNLALGIRLKGVVVEHLPE